MWSDSCGLCIGEFLVALIVTLGEITEHDRTSYCCLVLVSAVPAMLVT